MYVEVTFTNTQYVKARTLNAGWRKAKKTLKSKLGDKLFRELITDEGARIIPAEEIINPPEEY